MKSPLIFVTVPLQVVPESKWPFSGEGGLAQGGKTRSTTVYIWQLEQKRCLSLFIPETNNLIIQKPSKAKLENFLSLLK